MDAPKCRACGKREWNHVCLADAEPAPNRKKTPAKPPDSPAPQVPDHEPPPKTPAANATFDRTAYQREYMRKRRAQAKLLV
jgi:hypothetical protein